MRKKIHELVRELFERGRRRHHRSIIVIIGDRAKDQVINLYNLWLAIRDKDAGPNRAKPKLMWCYKQELGFSSHQHKRRKELTKKMKQGLYESESDNPFELFLTSADIRFCYYKDTQSILGSTYEALIFQDFEKSDRQHIVPDHRNGAGRRCCLFHAEIDAESPAAIQSVDGRPQSVQNGRVFGEVQPHFNERMMLSLVVSDAALFMDDELNLIQNQHQAERHGVNDSHDIDAPISDEVAKSLAVAEKNRVDLINSLESNKIVGIF